MAFPNQSAAPSFRARKKQPGEANPRMTGPPMQQGAGQGSMFAGGKQGGMPPRRAPMMADGGSGMMSDDPMPIGAPPPPPPPAVVTPPAAGSSGVGGAPIPVIKPESVGYHDDPQACQGCQYFGQDSNCAVLQMQVSPQGGCAAFEPGGEPDQDDQSGGMGMSDNGADDAGNPQLS